MIETRPTSGNTVRVLIVDNHAIVRQGLQIFLEFQDGGPLAIEVVGEAFNGIDAVNLANRLQPDIVLLYIIMPEMDGIQATSRIMECSPGAWKFSIGCRS
jgi:DNA-binding NarL/FixJ family response regulator